MRKKTGKFKLLNLIIVSFSKYKNRHLIINQDTIRTFFLILALFLLKNIDAQISDDFSDGDFANNPTWVGLEEWFTIDEVRQSLQLNAPAEAGSAWLFTPSSSMENAQWQFSFRMGFNPSSSNYAQVYLD